MVGQALVLHVLLQAQLGAGDLRPGLCSARLVVNTEVSLHALLVGLDHVDTLTHPIIKGAQGVKLLTPRARTHLGAHLGNRSAVPAELQQLVRVVRSLRPRLR
jgi:hypothetical protein